MSERVGEGMVVTVHHTLENDGGEVIDQSGEDHPLLYLHGASNIVPGLEEALVGKAVGDTVEVTVPPEKGYGLPQKMKPVRLRRSELPEGMPVVRGQALMMRGKDGRSVHLWITKVQGSEVIADMNHPLAGESLHFKVEIVGLRPATDDEKTHGHAHGPDGHGHGH